MQAEEEAVQIVLEEVVVQVEDKMVVQVLMEQLIQVEEEVEDLQQQVEDRV